MYNVIYYILQANSNVLSEVAAPAWLHRYIIGRKGANIQKITEQFSKVSNIRMTIPGKNKHFG